ncbi:MAG TPA: ASCH domain-containing protein [Flavisolibacter sp.]|nr:ASCH domain-containing protein [Flavisolibacter sp.]
MKVISVLQPWASLIVMGEKRIETRTWNTKYRGPLLIHASAGKKKEGHDLWHSKHCWDKCTYNKHFNELPFGAIIGQVNLVDTVKTSDLLLMKESNVPIKVRGTDVPKEWGREIAFGDYSNGRYGWLLSDPIYYKEHFVIKGQLNLWEFELPEPFVKLLNIPVDYSYNPNK